ncbi:MAG: type II and III secretion system protein family protein [Alphaproteobacteria bacterium]
MSTAMTHRISRFLALGLLAGLALAVPGDASYAAAATSSSPSVFYVPLNRSELISTNTDMGEVIITDPDVADVYVHGKRRVSVIGKHIGQTTLRIFDGQRNMIRSMDVYVTYDLPAVRRALKEFLPNEHIGVSMVNLRMALTGSVSSAEAASTAVQIAEEFVHDKLTDQEIETRKKHDPDSKSDASPVINLMRISSGQQVMLRIKIGEIQRTALKNLGLNLQAFNGGAKGFLIATGVGRLGGPVDASGNATFSFGNYTVNGSNFGEIGAHTTLGGGETGLSALVDALEQDGLLKTLAEPNLVALSGEEAQFLAGGEFPIPVPQSLGETTIEYKPFGVALKFTPYVLSPNRIRIKVQPEVSSVSNDHAITIAGGGTAPSFTTRRASTTVELAPGESFMLAGLMEDDMTSQISQLPGAGDIPILGALFRSTQFQRSETELVIAVTPYLVDPMKDSDVKLPTDDFKPASFVEGIFFGALGGNKGGSVEGPAGFMTD